MPRIEIKNACPSCKKLKLSKERFCEQCKPEQTVLRWADKRKKVVELFGNNPYDTARYRKLRKHVIQRDKALCQPCLKKGVITPFDETHHLQSAQKAPHLFFEESNLIAICKSCHSKITQAQSMEARGITNDNRK